MHPDPPALQPLRKARLSPVGASVLHSWETSLSTFDVEVKPYLTLGLSAGGEDARLYPMQTEEELRANFGLRLKAARKVRKLTQQDVADRFGVSKQTVSAWERGFGSPDPIRLRELSKLYNVSADALLWSESISPEAMMIAAGYDDMSAEKKQLFDVMWMGFYAKASESPEPVRIADEDRPPVMSHEDFVAFREEIASAHDESTKEEP